MIGVVPAKYVPYNAATAVGGTFGFAGEMFANVWTGIKQLPNKVPSLISAIGGAPRDPNSPMSVVGASRLGGQAVEDSQWSLFWLLLATLQFFLGVFNLLPLLPLDGGHIAVALYETGEELAASAARTARRWARRLHQAGTSHTRCGVRGRRHGAAQRDRGYREPDTA